MSGGIPGISPATTKQSCETAFALAEFLHHVGHLPMHFDELVDFLYRGAGAAGDAPFARGIEQFGAFALLAGHRGNNGLWGLEQAIVKDWKR